jgi:hypothetical protein
MDSVVFDLGAEALGTVAQVEREHIERSSERQRKIH